MKQEQINRKVLGYTYGSAFPLKMDLERQILSRYEILTAVMNCCNGLL